MNSLTHKLRWGVALLMGAAFLYSGAACDRPSSTPPRTSTPRAQTTTAQTTSGQEPAGARVAHDDPKVPRAKPYKKPDALLSMLAKPHAVLLPETGEVYSPSLARVMDAHGKISGDVKSSKRAFDEEMFTDTKYCATCHGDIYNEWRESMHGFASLNNPIYKLSFDDFRRDRSPERSQFCSGCHDPALLFEDEVRKPIAATNKRAHAGITCATCHGVRTPTRDGNASYVLTTAPINEPHDDASLAVHRARVAAPELRERTNSLCVSCHKGFLFDGTGQPALLGGVDDEQSWSRSPFAGAQADRIDPEVPEQNCVACHMPVVGNHRSHRFPGGHTTFAAMLGSKAQLKAVQDLLRGAATLDVHVVSRDATSLTFDVVTYNERTGHSFPGGAKDLKDTWLEVRVEDASGKGLAAAGHEHARTGADPTAERMRTVIKGDDGKTTLEHHEVAQFRTLIFDHTIGPRDAQVTRYVWRPADPAALKAKAPLKIKAWLRHRRLNEVMRRDVCKRAQTPTGQAFIKAAATFNGKAVDPCVAQPITDIDTATMTLPAAGEPTVAYAGGRASKAAWMRQYIYGIGLQHHVQEDLPETITTLKRALKLIPTDAPASARARVEVALGQVYARQGRTRDAVDQLAHAEGLLPDHPSMPYHIGLAFMRVWRFDDAIAAFAQAARRVEDDRVWSQLAIALGSVDQPRESHSAASRALALEPRNPHTIRTQMLGLRDLPETPKATVDAAARAFDRFKRDELANTVRDRCSSHDALCRRGRLPLRTFELVTLPQDASLKQAP